MLESSQTWLVLQIDINADAKAIVDRGCVDKELEHQEQHLGSGFRHGSVDKLN